MVGEITGESIKSAISRKIQSDFAITSGEPSITTYPTIYKEKIVQGSDKPCFFIWTMNVSQIKRMRNNYNRLYQMNVRYHPLDEDINKYKTLCDIGNRLLETLSKIDVGIDLGAVDNEGNPIESLKPVIASDIDFKIVDDVLQVFVNYQIRGKQYVEEIADMQTLTINNG